MKTRNLIVLLTVVMLAGSLLIAPAAAAQSPVTKTTVSSDICVLEAFRGDDLFVKVSIEKNTLENVNCSDVSLTLMVLPNNRFMMDFSPSVPSVVATFEFAKDIQVRELVHYGAGKPQPVEKEEGLLTVYTFSRYSGWF